MTPAEIAAQAVALGARLLDRKYKRWAHKVDTARLDSSSIVNCTLAQCYRGAEPEGGYARGAKALFEGSIEELRKHGFAAIQGVSWILLDEAWTEAINARTQ